MMHTSIFDLVLAADTPQEKDLQNWIAHVFPKTSENASFLLAIQLEKLFEMAIYENQLDSVHLLLQQGLPPNIRGDWSTTPLMWATCLGHTQIANLLITYGADQHAKSFYGKEASDFADEKNTDYPEYRAILKRKKEIHEQVTAGYLKPLGAPDAPAGGIPQKKKNKRQRQIDNGKGVDEIFKKINDTSIARTREINLIIE